MCASALRTECNAMATKIYTSTRREKTFRFSLLSLVVALVVLKAPHLLSSPRFWAEEGKAFFGRAFRGSFWDGILVLPEGAAGDYYMLCTTLPATLAAHVFPLELAPFISTYFALAITLLPFIIIIFGRSLVWNTNIKRVLACAIMLFCPTITGEVWLNTTNSPIYCGLIAFCILCEDLENIGATRKYAYRLLLLFCGLSGL